MHDLFAIHVGKCLQETLHDPVILFWSQIPFLGNIIEQLSTFQKLHYQVNGVLGLMDLLQLHDVRVFQLAHHFNLIDQRFLVV